MVVGIIGSGNIGSNIGRRAAEAGYDVVFSFAREPEHLHALAREVGHGSKSGTPRDAAQAEIVVLATPWPEIDDALRLAGSLSGRIVVDTTNPYTADGLAALDGGGTTGEYNARRMPGAKIVKAFNTLTADFQVAAHDAPTRVAMFFAGDDHDAKAAVEKLIRAVGFEPVDLGSLADSGLLDAPRRDGAVYGEAYAPDDAREIARLAKQEPARAAEFAKSRRL